mmetsp:Transcript_23016/g.36841  ORF Transcript_23016/g.36841 Transcript_23016/m.36841 type:complete len:259 (-) Transcript_23016:109-885(-)
MVGYSALDGEGTVDLLKEHHTRYLVVEDHFAQRQDAPCFFGCCAHVFRVSAGTTYGKGDASIALVGATLDVICKLVRGEQLAALVEEHEAVFANVQTAEEGFALFVLLLLLCLLRGPNSWLQRGFLKINAKLFDATGIFFASFFAPLFFGLRDSDDAKLEGRGFSCCSRPATAPQQHRSTRSGLDEAFYRTQDDTKHADKEDETVSPQRKKHLLTDLLPLSRDSVSPGFCEKPAVGRKTFPTLLLNPKTQSFHYSACV